MRRLVFAAVAIAMAVACGGGGGSATPPTAPTPIVNQPPGGGCDTLGLTSSPAILNGVECDTSRSAVVLLNMRDASGLAAGACSGTVIAERAILTAAHCLDQGVRLVRIFLGSGLEIVAESFIGHPAFRGAGPNDVGVVKMRDPIGRRPIPLLLSRDARVGETAVVAGWGRNQNDVPATLRAGVTTVTGIGTLLETQFGANVGSVCSGDSGGPILLSEGGAWTIAGVTSATSENICNTGTNFFVALRGEGIASFILGEVPDAVQR
ncbi:MAG TPA: trypsin-like serine protease [Vicinamibacterales bacterium]|nr:trypsin-like serine protease [Vicinamibacterales bacterium]